jgi:pantetheine-phosphate adenylyltransferase
MAQTGVALYPGSFDPITNGHIDLIERTLRIFDRIIVAIAYNPDKSESLFTVEERLEMIRESCREFGTRIEAQRFEGLLVDYARKTGAKVIIRGLRVISDFEYEFQMAMMNRNLEPGLETLFMMTGESYFYISSRLVKEVVSLGGNVSSQVPKEVWKRLQKKFKARK